jgi:hypothetical protein
VELFPSTENAPDQVQDAGGGRSASIDAAAASTKISGGQSPSDKMQPMHHLRVDMDVQQARKRIVAMRANREAEGCRRR